MNFSKETLHFLAQNRIENSKEWFHAHKTEYQQYVISPLTYLVSQLTPAMLEIDPQFVVEPKVGKTVSRIYRDIRFAKDKSLYRDSMWCVFTRSNKDFSFPPGFFFEISPRGYRLGCGYYEASTQIMEALRQTILANGKAFQDVAAWYEKQTDFAIEGDVYKRPRYADAPAQMQTWLERRWISVIHSSTNWDLLFSNDFPKEVEKHFQEIACLYKLLCQSQGI